MCSTRRQNTHIRSRCKPPKKGRLSSHQEMVPCANCGSRLFTSQTTRERPHWEQVARGTLAEFRAASARYPGDPWFEELIEDLKQVSPEFCQWWPHHDVRSSLDGHKVIEHPTLGYLEFEHFTLQVLNNPDIRIMIYSPDARTRTALQRLLEAMASRESNTSVSAHQ